MRAVDKPIVTLGRTSVVRTTTRFALGAALLLAAVPAHADTCQPPTPECHKKNGERLLATDPTGASVELLASYKLDERTETLTLYAQAVQADDQHALALETWQRIITFRESEVETAREAMAGKDKAKKAAAGKQQRRGEVHGLGCDDSDGLHVTQFLSELGENRIRLPAAVRPLRQSRAAPWCAGSCGCAA